MTLLTIALILCQTEAQPPPPNEETPPPAAAQDAPPDAPEKKSQPLKEEVEKATEEPPAAPLAPSPWTATLTGGMTWISGNVISLTFVLAGQATRKTDKTIFVVKAFAGYGEKFGPLPREILVFNAGATAQFDYRFNKTISILAVGGLDTDHVKSVEVRGFGELGVGFTWVDIKGESDQKDLQKVLVKTDVGVRVQPERRFQYYPTFANPEDVWLVGPRVAQVLHYAWSPTTYAREELEFLPNVIGPSRFLVNSVTKAAVGLVSVLSAAATFTVRYDSAPAAGRVPLDTIFTLGIEANL